MEIDNIEERLRQVEDKVIRLETEQPHLVDLMDKNTAAYCELQKTMVAVQVSLTKFEAKLNALDNRVAAIETQMSKLENKDKISVLEVCKRMLPWLIVIIAAIGGSAGITTLIGRIH